MLKSVVSEIWVSVVGSVLVRFVVVCGVVGSVVVVVGMCLDFWCVRKTSDLLKRSPQKQTYGRSPVCVRK